MQNKKFTKYLAVSLLAACGITGCDDIEARPQEKGDEAALLNFTDEVFGNNYQSINDSYHGDVASKTLDEILYTYAINVVGPYNKVIAEDYASKVTSNGQAIDPNSLVTLEDAKAGGEKLTKFIEQHKAYETDSADNSKKLVEARYNSMKKAVAEKMFSKLSSATENNKFNEKELLVSLYSAGSKVKNPYEMTSGYTKDYLVLPSDEPEDVFEGILHEEFYTGGDYTYIEDEVLPDIYRDALVQQYIFDVQSKSLGSSSARKVNYVAIKYDDLHESLYAEKLVKSFVTKWLLTDKNADTEESFDTLSSIWNGRFISQTAAEAPKEYAMLTALGVDYTADFYKDYKDSVKIDGTDYPFIKGSAYGDLVEDYAKLNDNPSKSTATKDYTGGNKYVKEIGFKLESEKILLNDHTTSGWAIKSSNTVSSLPDSVKNRLFNLSVATGINPTNENDQYGTASEITTTEGIKIGSGNKYVARYGNNFFVRNSGLKVNQDEYESIIFHDTSSHTYYIVNVEAAVSSNYMQSEAALKNYALRIDVASLLSQSDTNVSLSKKHWVEQCEIEYHDQSVYDYFESNFPELFEDD